MATQTKQNYFLSQVHQPFFMLGIINAIAVMLIFGLNHKGILTLEMSSLNFHVYSLIFLVFTNAFSGFLFTTFPRFCQSALIAKEFYLKLFFATTLGSIIFIVGSLTTHLLVLLGIAILFISHIFIFLKLRESFLTGMSKDEDSHWILMAHKFGLLGHALFFISSLGFDISNIAINISFYMYLIFLTFVVAQRMIPFFSRSHAVKDERFTNAVFVFFALKTLLSIFNDNTYVKIAEIFVDALLGFYMLGEFLRWKLPLFNSSAILWVLYLGLFWLPLSLFADAISLMLELIFDSSFYYMSIHLIAIGFLTTLLIGFGSRVILGHSGQETKADSFTRGVFYFVQIVLFLRVSYSLSLTFGLDLEFLFDISFSSWIVLFLLWAMRYAKVLVFGKKI